MSLDFIAKHTYGFSVDVDYIWCTVHKTSLGLRGMFPHDTYGLSVDVDEYDEGYARYHGYHDFYWPSLMHHPT